MSASTTSTTEVQLPKACYLTVTARGSLWWVFYNLLLHCGSVEHGSIVSILGSFFVHKWQFPTVAAKNVTDKLIRRRPPRPPLPLYISTHTHSRRGESSDKAEEATSRRFWHVVRNSPAVQRTDRYTDPTLSLSVTGCDDTSNAGCQNLK